MAPKLAQRKPAKGTRKATKTARIPGLTSSDGSDVRNVEVKIRRAMVYYDSPWWHAVKDRHLKTYSDKRFQEYRRWFSVKLAFKDVIGEIFAPDSSTDTLWHKHLLSDTAMYMQLCVRVSEGAVKMIHHRVCNDLDHLTNGLSNYRTVVKVMNRFNERLRGLAAEADMYPCVCC